jgi:hypothetical protein
MKPVYMEGIKKGKKALGEVTMDVVRFAAYKIDTAVEQISTYKHS